MTVSVLATVLGVGVPLLRPSLSLVFCFLPLLGFLLQHPSMLLNTIPPIGSSDFHGVQSFALVHHPEPVPVCQSDFFHNPSTCSHSKSIHQHVRNLKQEKQEKKKEKRDKKRDTKKKRKTKKRETREKQIKCLQCICVQRAIHFS